MGSCDRRKKRLPDILMGRISPVPGAAVMSQSNALRVSVTDLRRPGAARDVDVSATLPGLRTDAVEVPSDQPVHAHLHLERVSDGIVARGEIDARWQGLCSRCLQPVAGAT